MTHECPLVLSSHGGQSPWAGSRDFLRATRVDGVMETQGNSFLCRSDTCSSLRKEVKELMSRTKITLEYGRHHGDGGLGGSSGSR